MLKPRKRLTKKKLKEDKLVTFYFKATAWVEANSKYLTAGAVAVVLLFVAIYAYSNSLKSAERAASVELARAMRAYENSDYQNALTLLTNLVENYGNTPSGKLGYFYLANSFYQTGDYQNARKYYEKFASSFDGDPHILSSAMGGVAACYEQEQQYLEAAQQYLKVVKKYPKSIFAPQYLLRAARCYTLAEQPEKAKELYDRIIQEYPDSREKDEAVMLKSML